MTSGLTVNPWISERRGGQSGRLQAPPDSDCSPDIVWRSGRTVFPFAVLFSSIRALLLFSSARYFLWNSVHRSGSCPNHLRRALLGPTSFHTSTCAFPLLNPRGHRRSTKNSLAIRVGWRLIHGFDSDRYLQYPSNVSVRTRPSGTPRSLSSFCIASTILGGPHR